MVSIITVLVASTTYVELTYAVNNVLSPLKILRAPVTE
jgi:energy-coupling factor transporter transmembrane protein EcfT